MKEKEDLIGEDVQWLYNSYDRVSIGPQYERTLSSTPKNVKSVKSTEWTSYNPEVNSNR